jgi:Ca-activated chloride channel family protein
MNRLLYGIAIAAVASACSPASAVAPATPATAADAPASVLSAHAELRASDAAIQATDQPGGQRSGAWIGAAGESEYLLPGVSETLLGVWIDVPAALRKARAPADVALVIDTSGSMAGPKIENARAAARELVEKLGDGDIVSVTTFSDEARVLVGPTILSSATRAGVLRAIAAVSPSGGTNMYDGLNVAEANAQGAPPSHPVRRVVMISDGIANVGPTSPEILGALAARGARASVQVSAIGVGLDYDEHTLDALAERSNGRLYHLDEPREMTAILDKEMGLLEATAATAAVVEIVTAPGVAVVSADGVRYDQAGNVTRVPVGTMFGGQHREMILKLRVTADPAAGDAGRPLASVRLRFNDPTESGLERVQEVVARYHVTNDPARVEAAVNGRTRTIAATLQAGHLTVAAAQHYNDGRFDAADKQLAEAEANLKQAAARAKNDGDRQRVLAVANQIVRARAAAKVDAAAPAPARRARALEMNQAGMRDLGF